MMELYYKLRISHNLTWYIGTTNINVVILFRKKSFKKWKWDDQYIFAQKNVYFSPVDTPTQTPWIPAIVFTVCNMCVAQIIPFLQVSSILNRFSLLYPRIPNTIQKKIFFSYRSIMLIQPPYCVAMLNKLK